MTTTYAQARTPRFLGPTRAAILQSLADAGAPVAGWSARAPQRVLVDDFSARTVEESEIRAELVAMIDLSALAAMDPDWCAVWMTWFAEVYIPALPAVWDVPFATSSPPQTVAPTDVVIVQAASGAIFELAITVPALLSSTGVLRVRARAPGVGGNVSSMSITKILSAPAGLSLGVGGALVTAGRDLETPAAAIRRCLGKWAALGAGWTRLSFDYLIPLFAPTVTRWRVRDDNPDGAGTIRLIAANAAGAATGPEIAALLAGFTARTRFCLGCGGFKVVAAVEMVAALTATLQSDGSNPTLASDAAAALTLLSLAFPIGPAKMEETLADAVMFGASFPGPISIPLDPISETTTTIAVPGLTGFRGVDKIIAGSAGGITVPVDQVLVFSPAPAITVES